MIAAANLRLHELLMDVWIGSLSSRITADSSSASSKAQLYPVEDCSSRSSQKSAQKPSQKMSQKSSQKASRRKP